MSAITIWLNKHKPNSKGEHPIYIRVIKGRTNKLISTNIKVKLDFWDESNKRVKKGFPNSARANQIISKKLNEVQESVLIMDSQNKDLSSVSFKPLPDKDQKISFTKYFNSYIEKLEINKSFGTRDRARTVLAKLMEYSKLNDISFQEIDLDFLNRYDTYLKIKLNNKVNTVHSNFRLIRQMFIQAVKEDLIPIGANPFTKFQLKQEKSERQYLLEAEIKRISELNLSVDKRINDVRNIFVFACFSGGIRIADLMQMRWSNFTGTHLIFTTDKTKAQLNIKLPKKSLQILNELKPRTGENISNYIFPFLRNGLKDENLHVEIKNKTAFCNKHLKQIATLAKIDKNLSTHIARHSFATVALTKGISIDKVSKLLSHTSLKTTQIYAKILNKDLDKAMEAFDDE
ncbi:MAG: hypothetical protein RLZZ605_46 [Bacteroidota bacterium]|jgi:integrase